MARFRNGVSFSLCRLAFALLLTMLASNLAFGQAATGTPPYASFAGGPFDTVNLSNLNVHFAIPVVHKAGRGMPFTYDLSYDSSVWTPGSTWQSASNFGWRGDSEIATGYLSFKTTVTPCPRMLTTPPFQIIYSNFVYHDPYGTSHSFTGTATDASGCRGGINFPFSRQVTDGSGYSLLFPNNNTQPNTITAPSGQVFKPPTGSSTTGAATATDTNGNQISVNSSGVFTDTLGTTALTVAGSGTPTSPKTFTYTSPSGAKAYTVHYTNRNCKNKFWMFRRCRIRAVYHCTCH